MTTPSPNWNKERARPWLVLAVVLTVIGAFAAYTQLAEYQRIAITEQERVNTQARIVEENLVQQLKGVTRALDGIRSEIPSWQQSDHWHLASQHLTAMSDAMPGIRTFVITNANGTITAANRAQLLGQNFRYRDYFRTPHDKPDAHTLYVSPPFQTVFGVSAINVSRALLSAEGQFAGVVSATLSPEYFTILLNSILYAPDVTVSLNHGSNKPFLELPLANKMAQQQPATTRQSCVLFYLFPSTRCQISVSRIIQPTAMAMDAPLVVSVSRNMSATLREWQKDSIATIMMFAMLTSTLAVGLLLFQRRQRLFQQQTGQYEHELRHNAERFRKIASQVPGAIFQFLLRADGSTAVPYASDAISTIFRVTLDEIKNDAAPLFSAIHPDDLLMVVTSIQSSARELTHWDCQFRICFPGEEERWLHGGSTPLHEADGNVVWFGYISDITERKRDEENLRDKEHFLSTLTDVIPGLLSYWNTDLICTFANGGYLEWFGKDRHEMSGIHLSELLGSVLLCADEPYIEKVLAGEQLHFERTLPSLNGSRNIWVNYIPDLEADRVRGFYVMVTDVSELKQIQQQLSELNEQLTQRIEEAELANRSKSRFLATVAHEFRTPLSLLTSSSDILDRYGERLSMAEQAQQHAHIRNAADQMATLVDSVLTFNRLETTVSLNNPAEVDVVNFCTTLAEEMRLSWCSGHTFSVAIDESCGSAFLDTQLLRRVLENLLSNAFRYTAESGTVSLRIRGTGEQLRITVADSGIGIPIGCQEQIFQAFYRGSNVEARRGLGLGLSIVHEALSHLHGTIAVDSSIGNGTVMQVTIPCTRD